MPDVLTRRRFITLAAAAAGVPLLLKVAGGQVRPVRWEGTALGAPASIQLFHSDEAHARQAIAAALAELGRLEAIFSLYRPDSAISILNREGEIEDAPADFVAMVSRALSLAQISRRRLRPHGAAAVAALSPPLHRRHARPRRPGRADIAAALALVDWRAVEVDAGRGRVAFARPGMGLTLNSGAQGYITDRVADVLRAHGFDRMLVDMGEPRALSAKPDGSAWRIGIANPADPAARSPRWKWWINAWPPPAATAPCLTPPGPSPT